MELLTPGRDANRSNETTRVDTMQVLQVQFYYAGWVLPVVERRQPYRSSRNGIDRVSSRIRG